MNLTEYQKMQAETATYIELRNCEIYKQVKAAELLPFPQRPRYEDIAAQHGITRQRVGQIVTEMRRREKRIREIIGG